MTERTCIQWYGQKTNSYFKKVGVKQGCPLSPRLFTLTMHNILLRVASQVGKFQINNMNMSLPIILAFADDILLITENDNEVELFIDTFSEQLRQAGMNLNTKKTELLIRDPGNNEIADKPVKFGKYVLNSKQQIKYLGSIITSGLDRPDTVKIRINKALAVTNIINPFLKKHSVPWEIRKILFNTVICPTLLYSLKTCALTKANRVALRRAERKIIRILTTDLRELHDIPPRMLIDAKTITKKIKAAQIRYWAHILRRPDNSLLQDALQLDLGDKKVGRPCYTFNDTLRTTLEMTQLSVEDWYALTTDKTKIKTKCKDIYTLEEPSDADTENSSSENDEET